MQWGVPFVSASSPSCIHYAFLYVGTASSSLTGFQFGATSAARTPNLLQPVSGSVASAPALGLSFGTGEKHWAYFELFSLVHSILMLLLNSVGNRCFLLKSLKYKLKIVVVVDESSSFLAYNSRLHSTVVYPILHRDRFWAISIASGSVRLWDLRSCCMMLSHVMRGRPHGLHQSSGRRVDRILLASALNSPFVQCAQKGSGDMIGLLQWVWVVPLASGPNQ